MRVISPERQYYRVEGITPHEHSNVVGLFSVKYRFFFKSYSIHFLKFSDALDQIEREIVRKIGLKNLRDFKEICILS